MFQSPYYDLSIEEFADIKTLFTDTDLPFDDDFNESLSIYYGEHQN